MTDGVMCLPIGPYGGINGCDEYVLFPLPSSHSTGAVSPPSNVQSGWGGGGGGGGGPVVVVSEDGDRAECEYGEAPGRAEETSHGPPGLKVELKVSLSNRPSK
ncbi:unnamed protein product [Merluccius merluccius]